MQDQVSRKIAEALEVELTPSDEHRLAQASQPAGAAFELYLKGRVHLLYETRPDLAVAIESFEKARQLDPASALPVAGLADSYARMAYTFEPEAGWYARAVAATDQALAIDPSLPEGRYLKGRLLWSPQRGFDHAGALREFRAAVATRPSLNEAHHWLGILFFHVALFEESHEAFRQALAINPADLIARVHAATCRLYQGQWAEARVLCEEALDRQPDATWPHYQLAHALLRTGDRASAARAIELASNRFAAEILFHPLRAIVAALDGDRDEAVRQIALTTQNAQAFGHYHHAQYDVACAHALLGDRDQAIAWLADAAGNGFPCHTFFELDPLLAQLRLDPRFVDLVARLTTECDGYGALWRRLNASGSGASATLP